MNIINLTPHAITVRDESGKDTVLPPSGQVARVSTVQQLDGELNGLPVYRQAIGNIVGLPTPVEGTALVVSALVRLALPHRTDLFSPGELIRDSAGQPVACKGLVR